MSRARTIPLVLTVGLGLAFFGCVGLPRRRPPAETDMRGLAQAPRPHPRTPVADASPLRIPDDPRPVEPDVVKPASLRSPDRTPRDEPPPPAPVPPPTPPRELNPVKETRPNEPMPPAKPESSPSTDSPLAKMRQLHREAVRVHDGIDSYIVRLTRREVVGGKTQPEELILFKFRKEPYSVYFQWIGKEGQGREVVYVKGKHENKMHTILAAGDMPLMPAGKRFSIAPDSVLVRNRSRHPITEAGVGTLINRLGALLDAVEKGDGRLGKVAYLGPQSRPEFSRPAEAVEWSLPPGYDPNLPRGGKRWCYLDPDNHLPALVVTHDDRGREVEYYRYDRFQFPIPLDDADFDPDRLGGK